MTTLARGRTFLTVLLFTGAAAAQAEGIPATSFGVRAEGDAVRAGGPDWSARFDASGMEFTPALGQRAPRALPLHFAIDSVRRGDEIVFARGSGRDGVEPTLVAHAVRFAHSADLTETYDVTRDGIEQSFVFARRPAGSGDLVVRGLVTTELTLVRADDDGLRYEAEGLGGVTFGAVTGVDANGATIRGSIRTRGNAVEWVLPAAFVDSAAYPLVLDPPIGTAFAIANAPTGPDVRPSVAFDATTQRYLVVWNVSIAAGADEVRGQLVTAGGTVLGSGLLIGPGNLTRQAVANVNSCDRFLVAIGRASSILIGGPPDDTEIEVVAIDAASGAMSNRVLVADDQVFPFTDDVRSPVVGGDSRPAANAQSTLVVFRRAPSVGSNGSVYSRVVRVPATGDPVVTGSAPTLLYSGGSSASVTTHGGTAARWLVTWIETVVSGSPAVVRGAVIGAANNVCAGPTTFFAPVAGDSVDDAVAATPDGASYLVAWANTNGGADDVQAIPVTCSGSCGAATLTPGTMATVTGAGSQLAPAIAFAKDKYLLAWQQYATPSSTPRVIVKSLDAACATCGAETSVENTVLGLEPPAIAARFTSGDTSSDEALVVWSNSTIRGRLFEARGTGSVANAGGACGTSGLQDVASYSSAPVIGNLDFAFELVAPSAPIVTLVLGLSTISAACGPCTIVPALDILLPGTPHNALPLPCDTTLLGVNVWAQWVLLKPGGCSILPDFAFSNTLRFTIGE